MEDQTPVRPRNGGRMHGGKLTINKHMTNHVVGKRIVRLTFSGSRTIKADLSSRLFIVFIPKTKEKWFRGVREGLYIITS